MIRSCIQLSVDDKHTTHGDDGCCFWIRDKHPSMRPQPHQPRALPQRSQAVGCCFTITLNCLESDIYILTSNPHVCLFSFPSGADVASALEEGEEQARFSAESPTLIVGPCAAKANAKGMLATAMRCCVILAIVAMAFVSSAYAECIYVNIGSGSGGSIQVARFYSACTRT
jgi:hypothetical protein